MELNIKKTTRKNQDANRIIGNIIELVPAMLEDRQKIYEWCFHSETTKSHSGPPDYPNVSIPTFKEFYDEYADYFFTGSELANGRGFIITYEEKPVGFISYCSFHLKKHKAELDIWINCEANCGKGFGTDAVSTLAEHISKTLGVCEAIMRPSIKNVRAVNSYKKVGFKESDKAPNEYLSDKYLLRYGDGDYGTNETALLIKQCR